MIFDDLIYDPDLLQTVMASMLDEIHTGNSTYEEYRQLGQWICHDYYLVD